MRMFGRALEGVQKVPKDVSQMQYSPLVTPKLFSSDVSTRPSLVSGVSLMIYISIIALSQPPVKTPDFQPGRALQTNFSGDQCKCD